MTIQETRILFKENLQELYSDSEINELFMIFVQEITGYSRVEIRQNDELLLTTKSETLKFIVKELQKGKPYQQILIVYFGSILLGNLFSLYLYQSQSWYSAIGASGGVSGILFASIAMIPDLGIYFFFIPIAIPGYIFGLAYFSYSVYMMLNPRQGDNIGHAAHLGGAFFGLIYAVALQPEQAINNALYLGIMALPLIYMAYIVFVKKRIG